MAEFVNKQVDRGLTISGKKTHFDFNNLDKNNPYYGMTGEDVVALTKGNKSYRNVRATEQEMWLKAKEYEANLPKNTLRQQVEANREFGINSDIVGAQAQSFETQGLTPEVGSTSSYNTDLGMNIIGKMFDIGTAIIGGGINFASETTRMANDTFDAMGGYNRLNEVLQHKKFTPYEDVGELTEDELKDLEKSGVDLKTMLQSARIEQEAKQKELADYINSNYEKLPKWKRKELLKHAEWYVNSDQRKIAMGENGGYIGELATDPMNANNWGQDNAGYTQFMSEMLEFNMLLQKYGITNELNKAEIDNEIYGDKETKQALINAGRNTAKTNEQKTLKEREFLKAVNDFLQPLYKYSNPDSYGPNPTAWQKAKIKANQAMLMTVMTVSPQINAQTGLNIMSGISNVKMNRFKRMQAMKKDKEE